MLTFSGLDLRERFPKLPELAIQTLVALAFITLATGARLLIDFFIEGVVPYLLIFPALVAATLIAGGRAGLMTIAGCQLLAWYFVVPVKESFRFASAGDAVSLVLATIVQLCLLWFMASYHRAQRDAAAMLKAQSGELEQTIALLRQEADKNSKLREQEAALHASRKNLEAIYEASGDGLALCEAIMDEDGHVVDYQVLEVNRAHAELTAATREQVLAFRIATIHPPLDPRWLKTAERVLKTGLMHDFDIRSRATGRWLNIRVSRVSDTLFQQTFVDVSDRHRLEEQRRALLKEMSHRVMNNFQMIAGFLHLQATTAHPAAKDDLKTAERRIKVLANLHSLLAYTESEGEIDTAAYVKELCGYLESTLERPEAVTLSCETTELSLPTEKVVPLGFVVSELVTNSAKYAYPAPMSGAIRVRLDADEAGWTLTIQDEGRGIDEAERANPGGLGTRLVHRFLQQIGAKLVTTYEGGVRHEITYAKN